MKQGFILGIIVFGMASFYIAIMNLPYYQKERATESAKKYLKIMQIPNSVVNCTKDSDDDGFASCSYGSNGIVRYIECDSAYMFNTASCKKPKSGIIHED